MKRLLAIIDYQNDMVSGSLGFPSAKQLEAVIAHKIRACRKEGADILFTLDVHYDQAYEEKHRLPAGWGWALYGQIAGLREPQDKVICKHSYGSLDFLKALQAGRYDYIELCGVTTNLCVMSAAILSRAALPEAFIYIDPDAVAAPDGALHRQALAVMQSTGVIIQSERGFS